MMELQRHVYARKSAAMLALAALLAGLSFPAQAQDNQGEARLRKMEAEIRAIQRKVFPVVDGTLFKPEITAGQAAQGATASPPASSAVTDMLARLDAMEAQIARLTGQIEQNTNRITQLEARAGILTSSTLTSSTPASSTPAATVATPTPAPVVVATPPVAVATPKPAPTPVAATTPRPAAAAGPTAERIKAVQAIVKPQSDDPGDDEYSYGFRLWEARFFPEAQQQLKLFADRYPRHKRISWGRNLLGRAYLDGGNTQEAAKWFLQNYQADKRGDRAPDSLLYLAESMKRLKDTKRACIALAEFSETYAPEAAGRLKGAYDAARNGLKCS